jgi:cytochrome c556
MELIANKNAILGGMSRGEIPDDESLFTESATDLAALSNMLLDGFQEEEIAPNSRALPDIWANRADFEQKVQELQDAVAAVAQTAQQGDFMRAKELAADIGTRCGNCHRPYRAPVD